jgi:CDP-diglyceride synthetase
MNATVKRTIFGALFLVVMLGGLLFYETLYVILFAFITFVMLLEFYKMTMGKTYRQMQGSGIIVGVLLFLATNSYFFGNLSLKHLVCLGLFFVFSLMLESILLKEDRSPPP